MQIGTFDTAPFVGLADLVKIPHNRNKRALEYSCHRCLAQLDRIGKGLDDFSQSVSSDARLFEFLANVLREAKRTQFKFRSAAQLHSELGSVRKAIGRMINGSPKDGDYDLYLSFAQAIGSEVEAKVSAAA